MPTTVLAGRYELRAILGHGGMGEVHDGWDRRLERPVAVKLLRPELANEPDLLQRFEAEARSAAMLNHPNVVKVFDTGNAAGTPFIVMERLPGRTLADELQSGPVEPSRVRAILADMLSALGAAHDLGIVHRDIKPSNVLFTKSGTAKLGDFGIAKSARLDLTQTGQLLGTLSYLSPEQLAGSRASAESDLYSVGVVGYEALIGRRPFSEENPLALIRAIAEGPQCSVKQLCPAADDALGGTIDRALEANPGDRFRSAQEMLDALTSPGDGRAAPVPPLPARIGDTQRLPSAGTTTSGLPARFMGPFRNRSWRFWPAIVGAAVLVFALILNRAEESDLEPSAQVPTAPESAPRSPAAALREGVVAEQREVRDFHTILFRGSGRLLIEQTGSESLTIEAEPRILPLIVSEVSGGRLTLGPREGETIRPDREVVYRLSIDRLDELEASGSGAVEAARLDAEHLVLIRSGSGDSLFEGEAESLELSISGSGNFDGGRLVSRRARVDISGSGNAVVNVSQALEARVSGSGSIDYIGDPTVTRSVSGSGSVRRRG